MGVGVWHSTINQENSWVSSDITPPRNEWYDF